MTIVNDQNKNEKVMTAKEVSQYLRLPLSTIYDLAVQGKIRSVKCGRQWRFIAQDVVNYLHGIRSQAPIVPIVRPSEKRFYPRIKTEIPASIAGELSQTKDFRCDGMIRNISEGGVLFAFTQSESKDSEASSFPYGEGHPVRVFFELAEPSAVRLELKGRIVRVDASPQGGFGIKFRHLSKENREVLRDYVD